MTSSSRWIFALYIDEQTFSGEGETFYITGEAWEKFYMNCHGTIVTCSSYLSLYYRIRVEGNLVKEVEIYQ